ncbi:hypothetical protein L596_012784 [Steinernema carpocapsae]|uniref:SCP domain-containing protein n=1 Tax=Steinernema carpocapsae TaxID=34508 RepID=A0A4U5NYR6_STECR|nr:hypothetical protein L596_012784 [Steinernema carpocapsae]
MNSFDCFAFFVLLTLTSTDGGDSFSCDGEASKMSFGKTVLDEHNDLRTKLARGELLKDEKMRLVNMYKLKYNCTLEHLAKEWARHCTYDADKGSEGGANLGLIVQALGLPSLGKVTEDVLQETVNKWFTDGLKLLKQGEWKFFQEIVDMHDRRNPFVVTTDDYKIDVPAVPRFFQAAFSKLTQMGCAIKLCPKGELTPISKFYKKDMAILVCRYSGPMISGDSRVIVGEPVRNAR